MKQDLEQDLEKLVSVFKRTSALKELPRTGAIIEGLTRADADTIAAHSHSVSLLSYFVGLQLSKNYPQLDLGKIAKIAIVHDIAECVTGDLPTGLKNAMNLIPEFKGFHDKLDDVALNLLLSDLDKKEEIRNLIDEYNGGKTAEAKIVKFSDMIDGFSHIKARLGKIFPNYIERSILKLKKNSGELDFGIGDVLANWLEKAVNEWDDMKPKPLSKLI